MNCIFASSKYYKTSKANAFDVAPPIGYDFLHSKNTTTNKNIPLNSGDLVLKQVYDKSHYKLLSTRKMPFQKLQQFLKVSEESGKIEYISAKLLQIVRNEASDQIYFSIAKQYIPHWKPEYSMVELSQLLSNPRIQSATFVEDCALTKYFILCQGTDAWRLRYLFEYFNRRIVQYDVECLQVNHNHLLKQNIQIHSKSYSSVQPPANIDNVEEIKKLIAHINESNKKKDPLYSGVHFYFADFTKKSVETADYLQREALHFSLLRYYIVMMTGILAEGQTAVIKICGAFKHRTFQLIFMLRLIFNGKVALSKPFSSNPFLPDSYVICEHFNKQNGDYVHSYLLDNYNIFAETSEKKLLDPKRIFKEDLHSNIKSFNQNLIRRGIQQHLQQFKSNMNTEYYPQKSKFILPKYAVDLQSILSQMIKLPDQVQQTWNTIQKEKQPAPKEAVTNNSKDTQKPSGITSRGLFAKKKPDPSKQKK